MFTFGVFLFFLQILSVAVRVHPVVNRSDLALLVALVVVANKILNLIGMCFMAGYDWSILVRAFDKEITKTAPMMSLRLVMKRCNQIAKLSESRNLTSI